MKAKIHYCSRLLLTVMLLLAVSLFFSTEVSAETKITQKKVAKKYDSYGKVQNGLGKVRKNGKYGLVNASGKEILECAYSDITIFDGAILAKKYVDGQDTMYGLFNKKGKTLVEFGTYSSIEASGNNTFYVYTTDRKRGLINQKGKELIVPGTYADFYIDSDTNLIKVTQPGATYGLLDSEANTILDCEYGELTMNTLDNNYTLIDCWKPGEGRRYYIISASGEIIAEYDKYTNLSRLNSNMICAKKDDLFAILNSTGEVIVEYGKYETVTSANHTNLALVTRDGESYYVNASGVEIYKKDDYDSCSSFCDGVAVVKKGSKFGVIDTDGNIIVPLGTYDTIVIPKDGIMQITKKDKIGLINTSGKEIVKPGKYEIISNFTCGIATVEKNDKKGVINSSGKEIVKLGKYKYCYIRQDGRIDVETSKGQVGCLTNAGKVAIKPGTYKRIGTFYNGYALVYTESYNANTGVIDTKGNLVVKTVYEDIDNEWVPQNFETGGLFLCKGKTWYIFTIK